MKFPSIASVRKALVAVNRENDSQPIPGEDDTSVDVRLQVYLDSSWAIRVGSPDYDQDHRGYFGASSVPGSSRRFNATDTAKNLIDQCREAHAAEKPDSCDHDELDRLDGGSDKSDPLSLSFQCRQCGAVGMISLNPSDLEWSE